MGTNPYQSGAVAIQSGADAHLPPPPQSPLVAIARSVLGVIAGIIVGGIVVALIEIPGMFLHPLPEGVAMDDAEALRAHFAKAPFVALLGVAIAWTAGPLVGSWLAAYIARRAFFAHGMIVGFVFAALDVMNLRSFPHPAWLGVVGVLSPIAMSWLGSSLAERMVVNRRVGVQPYDMRSQDMACK